MSTTNPNNTEAKSLTYPLLEELETDSIQIKKSSDAADRICWTFDATWPDAISVMRDSKSPDCLEPYFLDGNWHDIAQESITEPKVSSITIGVQLFDYFERDWVERHHTDLDNQWGELPDYDPDEDSDREEHLLSCCGEPRPRKMNRVKMVVTAASGGFVTIHDYLSTLHPWLMGLRDEIIRAETVWETPFPEMVVEFERFTSLDITEKDSWIRQKSGVPVPMWPPADGPVVYSYPPVPSMHSGQPEHSVPPPATPIWYGVPPTHSIYPIHPGQPNQPTPPILPGLPANTQLVYEYPPFHSAHSGQSNHPTHSGPPTNMPLAFGYPPPHSVNSGQPDHPMHPGPSANIPRVFGFPPSYIGWIEERPLII